MLRVSAEQWLILQVVLILQRQVNAAQHLLILKDKVIAEKTS